MINKISFKNYKGFDEGEIKIKPITILLGANSVGKSSIIQLLLMLQQTAMSDKYKSALRLHGEFVSLGENENIFKNKDTDKDLEINFNFYDKRLFSFVTEKIYGKLISSVSKHSSFLNTFLNSDLDENDRQISFRKFLLPKKKESKSVKSKSEFSRIVNQLSEFSEFSYKDKLVKDRINDLIPDDHLRRLIIPNKDRFNKAELDLLYDLTMNLKDIKDKNFDISFTIKNIRSKKKNVLKISSVKLSNLGKCIFKLDFNINKAKGQYTNIIIKSDFFSNSDQPIFGMAAKMILEKVQYDATVFSLFYSSDEEYDFFTDRLTNNTSASSIITEIFSSALDTLRSNFKKEVINYVSPLRAHPKRYYFLDRARINTVLDTLDGNSLTEILKENDSIKSSVNNWLEKFNISVNVATLEEVIHKLKVTQNRLNLDITDVGFGISQVLPVIVQGFLSYPESLTIIEQPEIHLHPKMQADLADLFIDIIFQKKKKNPFKFLIIETHSEYLLKRLRRRMAEGLISPNHVSIYFFCSDDKDSVNPSNRIKEKEISKGGAFEWPKNFYSGELLKDTTEFIKRQGY